MEIEPEKINNCYEMMDLINEVYNKSNLNINDLELTIKELIAYYNLDTKFN